MSKYANYEIKTFLILRNSKGDLLMTQNDHADSIIFGYINPPGGHLEVGETVIDAATREAEEEMGVKNLMDIEVKGIINVSGFKDLPVLMFVVTAEVPDSEIPAKHEEGTPIWVNIDTLKSHKVLEDVEKIITLVQKTPPGKMFHVVSKFENRKLISFNVLN